MALAAEGPTDYRFLQPVLYRLTEDLCLRHGRTTIEVGPVVGLDLSRGSGGDRTGRIVAAAQMAAGSYHVLFLHTDGAGDPEAALRERVEPWRRGLAALGRADERAVAVVPVREMEAWALCDGNALREAFGTTLPDDQLGLPRRTSDLEGVLDPKRMLDTAYERAFQPRVPKRPAVAALEAIAERVDVERLRLLPAFRTLEQDLRAALRELQYVS
ncbi:MAG: DUF4276 family protein [Vicinamibacteria bacterium]